MASVKLYGKVQVELAAEFARIVGGSAVVVGNLIRFEGDDVVALRDVAGDADLYWRRLGKRARARAAAELREAFAAIECNERYLRTYE